MKSKTVLIIDDENSIRKFLRIALEAQQFEVFESDSGEEGLIQVVGKKPDVVILDLGLGGINGIEVLRRIREFSTVPVLVLTVQDSEDDKVLALDVGADDYLTKPFGVPELMARLRAMLRRAQGSSTESKFESGSLVLDVAGHTVMVEGVDVKLTSTEFSLLAVLVKNAGKVVTHRMLLKEVWGPNAVEHTQYLRVYMGQIRKKLQVKPGQAELIETESGVGYRFLKS